MEDVRNRPIPPEISKFQNTTSQSIVNHLKSIFARHGIPDTLVSEYGPQYSSSVYQTFSKDYGFRHQTSSPHYPQGNGEAERAVQTVKRLIRNATDPSRITGIQSNAIQQWKQHS